VVHLHVFYIFLNHTFTITKTPLPTECCNNLPKRTYLFTWFPKYLVRFVASTLSLHTHTLWGPQRQCRSLFNGDLLFLITWAHFQQTMHVTPQIKVQRRLHKAQLPVVRYCLHLTCNYIFLNHSQHYKGALAAAEILLYFTENQENVQYVDLSQIRGYVRKIKQSRPKEKRNFLIKWL
jgi:hypothetical protein